VVADATALFDVTFQGGWRSLLRPINIDENGDLGNDSPWTGLNFFKKKENK